MSKEKSNEIVETVDAGDDEEVLNDPSFLAKFQDMSMDCRAKALEDYHKLPKYIRRRVNALKRIQHEAFKTEANFFRRMTELEKEFESKYADLYLQRRDIINGDKEPTDSECEWKFNDDEDEEEEEAAGATKVPTQNNNNDSAAVKAGDDVDGASAALLNGEKKSGVPDFWLTIFRNVPILSDSKEECDDDILTHLRDLRCVIHTGEQRSGFTLEFHFSTNDYFTDSVLKKSYFVRFDPSTRDPLSYEGPEIVEAKGCNIHWKPGKNVTFRSVKKPVKKGRGNEKKTVTKTVKTDSFFNFFSPPDGCLDSMEDEEEIDEELESELQTDFELGQFIREQIIPRGVLYFTGEGIEDEDFDSEGEEMDEDDEDDESGEPQRRPNQRSRGNSGGNTAGVNKEECKQQ